MNGYHVGYLRGIVNFDDPNMVKCKLIVGGMWVGGVGLKASVN